jgi:hypothetical protein
MFFYEGKGNSGAKIAPLWLYNQFRTRAGSTIPPQARILFRKAFTSAAAHHKIAGFFYGYGFCI